MNVSGTYDGKMALHEGTLNDCSAGDQGSTKPILDVADGGTVKNVIFSVHVGDGIHCEGSCTIDNVWFNYVCDDAISMLGGSGKTATITNSGFKGARDKTIQHNGNGSTVVINNVYIETAGKLYRSCGQGCSSSDKRTAMISNVVAIGTDQIAGVSTNDHATLSNICTYRVSTICHNYQPGSDTDATTGANGTGEGPSANCTYKPSDTHGLVDHVKAGVLTTDVICTGRNSAKDGSTNNTACVTGFENCLNGCAPGQYGFKQLSCSAGKYAASGSGCVMSSDATVASNLNGTLHSASATATETNNNNCTSQWAWGTDGSGKYCVCVFKPGYYQASSMNSTSPSSWWVWDCQSQWW